MAKECVILNNPSSTHTFLSSQNILSMSGVRQTGEFLISEVTFHEFFQMKWSEGSTKLHGLSLRANYTDRAAAAGRRS
jgi:hypothetical protein